MKTKLTSPDTIFTPLGSRPLLWALPSTRWLVRRVLVLVLAVVLLGGGALPAERARRAHFTMAVANQTWDLVGWEAEALARKTVALFQQPADAVPEEAAPEIVKAYLARAGRIGQIEDDIAREASELGPSRAVDQARLSELAALRQQQEEERPLVEQIIERQVAELLYEHGFVGIADYVWPPVSFTFVEPPKKLIVSRRDQIATIYSRMLEATIGLENIEKAEAKIGEQYNAVAYITEIGGLGAFPTMVVDRASLRWVLSTVAHEWVHNYLVFHPLGWNYFSSQDLTTLNETVAEIVGNEIGDKVLARFYPDMVPSPLPVAPPATPDTPSFVFQDEMRKTRIEVDRLLAAGQVEEAEAYMEARRREFVEQGYPLRVLNQAYFAFHGSYGTSPASTSPIGPNLKALRALQPDLATFLETVRSFTSVEDLDRALLEWEDSAP